MGLLSRRDHSKAELVQKLRQRGFSVSEDAPLLDQLQDWGYLDDTRFAMGYVRSRFHRGVGPNRLRQELRTKGVGSSLIEAALQQQELDWWAACLTVAERRYHRNDIEQYASRQKAYRFLMGRGFESEQIQFAFDELRQHG
ncbi:regulatory protein [Ferrimonas sediminum]|uniref:Regulatory protein RecX n=1 Tax=Ferrimonas sediminum TaxID=718193 RepID=A0A1G8PMI6_9GAMM|nr:regulatory protein [Ferrimonas sediminum]